MRLTGIIASIIVVLGSGAAYACLVWLPQHARSQLEAQLTAFSSDVDVSYADVSVNPFDRSVTLANVAFQHHYLPFAGTIGSLEFKPAGETTTALAIASPVLKNGDQQTLRAGLIEVASVDQAYVFELLEVWKGGNRAELERLMELAPGGAVNGLVVDNLQLALDDSTFDLDRLTVGSMDSFKINQLALEGATWTTLDTVGGKSGIDVGLIGIKSFDHGYLQQIYRALLEGGDDAVQWLLINTPDGFVEDVEIRDIAFTPPTQASDRDAFAIGSLELKGISAKEVREFAIRKIRIDAETDDGAFDGGVDAITLDALPLWPITESLRRSEDCIGAGCGDPAQAFEQLIEIVAEWGGLEFGGINISGLELAIYPPTSNEASYELHTGDFSISNFTFEISANGRPYLENFTLRSEAEESYSLSLFDTSSFPPEALQRMPPDTREFLRIIGEVLRENAVPLKYLQSSSEITLTTDPSSGTAAFLMQGMAEQRGELQLDFSVTGIPEDVLTFKDLDQAGNAMLAQGTSLVGASVAYVDQGLFNIAISLIAKRSGLSREQLISDMITQMQINLAAAPPEISSLILPPVQQFLSNPQSLSIRLSPERPLVASAVPFLAQSDPQQFLKLIGFEIVANEQN